VLTVGQKPKLTKISLLILVPGEGMACLWGTPRGRDLAPSPMQDALYRLTHTIICYFYIIFPLTPRYAPCIPIDMKRVALFLTEVQIAALRKAAKRTGLKMAELVRRFIDDGLRKQ